MTTLGCYGCYDVGDGVWVCPRAYLIAGQAFLVRQAVEERLSDRHHGGGAGVWGVGGPGSGGGGGSSGCGRRRRSQGMSRGLGYG